MYQTPRLVVVGASAGGVTALLDFAAAMPADFPAPICIVLHIGEQASILPELLQHRGPLPARHAKHGEPLRPGNIYVAPPDRHFLVDETSVHLDRGPRENFSRPAIDPLFRSAAVHWRERAIGVILSGFLDDGAAGLNAIAECGGVTIVQDPATAIYPDMPRNALAVVDADHVLALADLPARLQQLAGEQPSTATRSPVADRWVRELEIYRGDNIMENLNAIAGPSTLTCPDCGGVLWQVKDSKQLRFRCHTGHAFSSLSLECAQDKTTQESMWATLRSLQEKEILLRRLAAASQGAGDAAGAEIGRAKADEVHAQAEAIRVLIGETPGA